MNIQPDTYWGFAFGVSYVPSRQNGSGCRLVWSGGVRADVILKYRNRPTWVSGVTNYKNIEQFIGGRQILKWFELTAEHLDKEPAL